MALDVPRGDFSTHGQVERSRRLYNRVHATVDKYIKWHWHQGAMMRPDYQLQVEEALQSGPAPEPRRCGFCRARDDDGTGTWNACWCVASSTLWDYTDQCMVDLHQGYSRWLTHVPPAFAEEAVICIGGSKQPFWSTRDSRIISTLYDPDTHSTCNYAKFAITIQRGYRAWIRRRAIQQLNLWTPVPSAVLQFVLSTFL